MAEEASITITTITLVTTTTEAGGGNLTRELTYACMIKLSSVCGGGGGDILATDQLQWSKFQDIRL